MLVINVTGGQPGMVTAVRGHRSGKDLGHPRADLVTDDRGQRDRWNALGRDRLQPDFLSSETSSS